MSEDSRDVSHVTERELARRLLPKWRRRRSQSLECPQARDSRLHSEIVDAPHCQRAHNTHAVIFPRWFRGELLRCGLEWSFNSATSLGEHIARRVCMTLRGVLTSLGFGLASRQILMCWCWIYHHSIWIQSTSNSWFVRVFFWDRIHHM